VSDLSRWLYREWANDDPAVMEAGMHNLAAFTDTLDLTAALVDRSFSVDTLDADDTAEVERPGRSELENCASVSVAYASRQAIAVHAEMHTLADQQPFEPTAEYYDRRFPEQDDPACFIDRTCAALITFNELARQNELMVVDLLLGKEFRWVSMVDGDGEATGRWAFVARSWMPESGFERDGGDVLVQSYATDVWMEQPDGATVRYQALYSETIIQGLQDDFDMRGFLAGGIDDSFAAHDDAIGQRL